MSGQRQLETLSRLLDRRSAARDVVQRGRVIAIEPDGIPLIQALDGSCARRGAAPTGHAVGQVTLTPSGASPYSGTAGVGARRVWGNLVAGLRRQEPRALPRGEQTAVTYHGRGLTEATTLEYLTPEGRVHPEITVDSVTYVSDRELRALVTVTAAAPLHESAPIAFSLAPAEATPIDDPTDPPDSALPHRADDVYEIALPTAPAAYLAYWIQGTTLVAGLYTEDGVPAGILGQTTVSGVPEGNPNGWINPLRVDPTETVTAGAATWIDDQDVVVHDFATDTSHRFTVPAEHGIPVWSIWDDRQHIWVATFRGIDPIFGTFAVHSLGPDLTPDTWTTSASHTQGNFGLGWGGDPYGGALIPGRYAAIVVTTQDPFERLAVRLQIDGVLHRHMATAMVSTLLPDAWDGAVRGRRRWRGGLGGESEGQYNWIPSLVGWPGQGTGSDSDTCAQLEASVGSLLRTDRILHDPLTDGAPPATTEVLITPHPLHGFPSAVYPLF